MPPPTPLRRPTPPPGGAAPFNPLPPVVVALAAVIAGLEALFQLGEAGILGGREAVGWRLTAIRDWGLVDQIWARMWETRTFPPAEFARLLTYPLIHGSLTHAAFVAVFVLALGNVCGRAYPGWRLAAIFFGAGVAGGLAWIVLFDASGPLFGGYPAAYGLIGAFAFLTRMGLTPVDPDRAFLLIGLLLAIQPVFGLATGAGLSWVPSWVADAVGAAAGYGLAQAMYPGWLAQVVDRIRRR
jgi:membrane associated rhomboid family serine protease